MLKITRQLAKSTYEYEEFNHLKDGAVWGETLSCNVITGKDAKANFKKYKKYNKKYILINENDLNDNTLYIFRWDKSHTKLIAGRVSMSPKTMANYDKGNQRFNPNYNTVY